MTRRRGLFFIHTLLGGLMFPLLPAGCGGTEAAPPEALGTAAAAICSATFAPVANYPQAGNSMAKGDLNGDGFPDLVFGNSNNTVSVMLNQGNGTFAAPISYPATDYVGYVAVADFNGDGAPDIAAVDIFSNGIDILINQGNGTFAAPVHYATAQAPTGIAAVDLNGDGFPDLATVTFPGMMDVLLNQGDGTFAVPVRYTAGANADGIIAADMNGDGVPDILVASTVPQTANILLNQGNGTFAPPVSYAAGGFIHALTVADLNGDGLPDIAATDAASLSVLLNQGGGTFAAPVTYPAGVFPGSFGAADFNGDGFPDLAVGDYYGGVSVLMNNGDGTLAGAVNYAGNEYPFAVVVGDLNGDGLPDIGFVDGATAQVGVILDTRPCNAPVTVTIQRAGASGSVFDTALDSELPTMNNGASQGMPVGLVTTGKIRSTLLRFDLSSIPAGAHIVSAKATLNAYTARGTQKTRAHVVTVPWAESTATWQSFPSSGYQTPAAAVFPGVANVTLGSGIYEPTQADFTALVQGWYSGAVPNNGVFLEENLTPATQSLTGVTTFCTSEWATPSLRPALTVTYVP